MKGIIALDIDGTITPDHHHIPTEVVVYLEKLHKEGWRFVFITGRTFSWGHRALQTITFPYLFAVQNGAIILQMPQQLIVVKKYLEMKDILVPMEEICRDEPTDFVIFTGFEFQDTCFYRPEHFSDDLHRYLLSRCQILGETWHEVSSFHTLDIPSFPSIKSFGEFSSLSRMVTKIEERLGLHMPLVKDPYNPEYFVAQATHPEVNKGQALADCIKILGKEGLVIAAGDDNNDRPMLKLADVNIVMSTAPADMLEKAHIIAPAAKENGIIQALEQAVRKR